MQDSASCLCARTHVTLSGTETLSVIFVLDKVSPKSKYVHLISIFDTDDTSDSDFTSKHTVFGATHSSKMKGSRRHVFLCFMIVVRDVQ